MSALGVEEFAGSPAEWDDCVRGSEGWTHCHLWGWRVVMREALGHETFYLCARTSAGQLEGVLPLVRVRSVLFGHFLVSMPFLNYGGPLGTDEAVLALATAAAHRADAEGCRLLELRSRYEQPIQLPASHRKVTVTLRLAPGDPEAVMSGFPAKLRSQVRRPMRDGIEVRFGPDQLEPFYAVFARHMRDLGTPVLGRRFFESISSSFGDDVWFGCAWHAGSPVAAGCGFRWGPEFEMTWASALREHNRTSANMLLYWRFMERAANEDLTTFNFGRCTPGSGTHRFKQQWGGEDEILWWYQRESDEGRATPHPDAGSLSVGPKIWRHLPLAVANAVGPRIVRFIP